MTTATTPTTITDDEGFVFKPFDPIEDNEDPSAIPLSLVPDSMRPIVGGKSAELEVPVELPLSVCLSVVAAVTQSRWSVKVKEGFEVPINCYIAVPADPGEMKTPTIGPLIAPLIQWEKHERERAKLEDSQHETKRRLLQKKIGKLERQAEKDDADLDAIAAEIDEAKREMPPEIVPRRLLADDATPEALGFLLGIQRGNLSVLSDEGAAFLRTIGGHYNDGKANIDGILRAFDGSPVRIDRSNGRDVHLDSARLTLCLLIQKAVAEDLLSNSEFVERGLVQRFLWMLPSNSRIGERTFRGAPTDHRVIHDWHTLVGNLLKWAPAAEDDHGTTTHPIGLTTHAMQVWDAYRMAIERSVGKMDEQDVRRQVRLKWAGQVLRLAGLIHCADFVAENPDRAPHERAVGEKTMQHAVALASVLLDHADHALSAGREDRQKLRMTRVLKMLNRHDPEPVLAGELWRNLRNASALFPDKTAVEQAATDLFNRGYIRFKQSGKSGVYRLTEAALFSD